MYKFFLTMFTTAFLVSCAQPPSNDETANFKTLTIQAEDRIMRQEYSARLEGQQVVEIRPQVSGLITHICIGEGQNVKKGQTLFVIDQVPYRAAFEEATANVKSAEAKLATARLNYESTQMLREKNVVQDFDLSTAANEVAAAEAAVAQANALAVNARNNLSYTEVKSPVDGVAGMIAYRVGSLVSSNISTPLVTVTDDSRMYAYFSMSEGQVIDLVEQYGSLDAFMQNMSDVQLRMAGGKIFDQSGRIAAVSGIVNAGTGAVTLRADFPNAQHLLRSGGSASVIVPTELSQVIVIPQSATYELQNRRFAYKVVDGKTQSVPVTLYRLNNGTEYVIEDGLQPGDVIIAEGAGLLKDGVAVSLQTEKE